MGRSRLPLLSLLGLVGALLMLSREGLVMKLSPTPVTDPDVQTPLAFTVEQYNLQKNDSANYYKVVKLSTAPFRDVLSDDYVLNTALVKTTCEKKAGNLTYKKIQECEPLPGNDEIRNCTFIVRKWNQAPYQMSLGVTVCG